MPSLPDNPSFPKFLSWGFLSKQQEVADGVDRGHRRVPLKSWWPGRHPGQAARTDFLVPDRCWVLCEVLIPQFLDHGEISVVLGEQLGQGNGGGEGAGVI